MAYFLVGCALLLFLIFAGRLLVKADPQRLAGVVRKAGGLAALGAAGFLILRGALPIAIPLAVFGLSLLQRGSGIGIGGPFGSAGRTPGQKSRIKTGRLEMELDHDSGQMDGQCLSGRFAGRQLSILKRQGSYGAAGGTAWGWGARSGSDGGLSRLAPAGMARRRLGAGRARRSRDVDAPATPTA